MLAIPDSRGDASTSLHVEFLSSFGEDACGHIYAMGLAGGNNVFRIRQTDPPPPDCTPTFQLPELTGWVDNTFQIHLHDGQGQELDGRTLPAGAYRVVVSDDSTFHDFHLLGPVSCVPESECVECQADLMPRPKVAYCKRHGVPECPLDHPEIAEVEVNPLLVRNDGVVGLDARIVLGQ